MSTAPSRALETFPNPQIDRDYIIEIRSPEFTCLCPKTGQPDFATLYLEYVPDQLCVELKSFKLYIWSFRNEGHFHEKVTNTILNDLVAATRPRYMRLRAEFNVRGGVYTNVTAEYRQPGWTPLPPPPGHLREVGIEAPAATEPAATAPASAPSAASPYVDVSVQTLPITAKAESAPAPAAPAGARSDRFRMLARRRGSATPEATPTPEPSEPKRDLYIGIDLGTAGCRAAVLDAKQRLIAFADAAVPAPLRQNKQITQDPNDWWKAVGHCLKQVLSQVDAKRVHRVAVAGTSSTFLLCDKNGQPVTPGLMYNDTRAEAEAERIAALNNGAAAHASSSLAKLLWLQNTKVHSRASHALHQADWIANRLTGHYGHSDYHNCLKLGYDPQRLQWPDWLSTLEANKELLPEVHAPGDLLGTVSDSITKALGLFPGTEVVAGTTDGVAAFLTTDAREPGHGATALGNTLVLKLLSKKPLVAGEYGIYSHRLGNFWLAGGASNSGGAVLLQYFTREQLEQMAPLLDPDNDTDLNYYPLLGIGERFPINDPEMEPKLEPLPGDSTVFMQGIMEGVANIEARGYELLQELGAPKLSALWTTGGGSQNVAWARIRERILGIRPRPPKLPHAACGAALLAMGMVQKTFA